MSERMKVVMLEPLEVPPYGLLEAGKTYTLDPALALQLLGRNPPAAEIHVPELDGEDQPVNHLVHVVDDLGVADTVG